MNLLRKLRVASLTQTLVVGATLLILPCAPLCAEDRAAEISTRALQQMMSKVHFTTLGNGIRVIVYRRAVAPVFAGTVTVRVGGTDEPEGKTGIAHMLEHMAFKGTKTLGTKDAAREEKLLNELESLESVRARGESLLPPAQQRLTEIYRELDELWVVGEYADQFKLLGGAGMNATTDSELTRYYVDLPSNAFEVWCALEADRLLNPVMRQFYKERDVVLEERRMRVEDDPSGKLYELLLGAAFQQHRYRNPVIGYPTDVARLTASEVAAFRAKYYVPSNIVVSVVGDLDPVAATETIRRYFEQLPVGPAVVRPSAVEPEQRGERRVELEAQALPQLIVGYHKPNYPQPDDVPISLLSQVLAESKLSPLYRELVEEKQLATEVTTEEAPGGAYPNLLLFLVTPRAPHTAEEVLTAFDAIIDRVVKNGVTEEELARAKRSYAMTFLAQLGSNRGIALSLASSEVFYNSWRASLEWMSKMLVTDAAEVQRAAARYLVRSNRTIGTIVTQSSAVTQSAQAKR